VHALREFEQFYNRHRPHQGIANARPLYARPSPIPASDVDARAHIRRRDRLGGILHEYQHAALPERMRFPASTTPDASPAVTTPQVTASIHDFARVPAGGSTRSRTVTGSPAPTKLTVELPTWNRR
jgi:hypothetical protein